jgi:hypothetical protein
MSLCRYEFWYGRLLLSNFFGLFTPRLALFLRTTGLASRLLHFASSFRSTGLPVERPEAARVNTSGRVHMAHLGVEADTHQEP